VAALHLSGRRHLSRIFPLHTEISEATGDERLVIFMPISTGDRR